ncbi:hypothetical protein MSIM_52940 [Mycobacterium simiae]|nr:hypothetical protein MSIM_52940 [Mycobacterium simiae]
MRDADVGPQVTPDDHVVAGCESPFGSLVPHGQHRWGWSAHEPTVSTLTANGDLSPIPASDWRVFAEGAAGKLTFMPGSDSGFPDDVPIADAVEQQRATGDFPVPDDDDDADLQISGELPLEATESDWQEQQETVVIDPELDAPGQ